MEEYLKHIHSPADLKKLDDKALEALSEEIRDVIIKTVSDNGGHLASNLGVVELSIALGLAFQLPEDRIVWDVGHQSYPYKLLTGRYGDFGGIRKEDGLSGFPNPEESPYDLLYSGHSSTSISAALGVSVANEIQGAEDRFVVAVIGDGALTGGLAYEGLNNAGRRRKNFIVILNDNNMSISKNVGSLARHLTYIRTRPGYIKIKTNVENALRRIPGIGNPVANLLRGVKRGIKKVLYRSTIFENLGFSYYGPMDGHDIKGLREALENVKNLRKPVLLHVITDKGKGYQYAEQSPSVYHGLSGFDVETGMLGKNQKDFSAAFGETLCEIAAKNLRVCAITAAMCSGTGLAGFKSRFRDRFFDVGISEEHAVTFAGGLSANGLIPVFAVYSTFLQRAYDQLIHDVSLQEQKVILAIDRAGVVGEDGKTHQGVFDVAFLSSIPEVTAYAPAYYDELSLYLRHLVSHGAGLCALRYPRGVALSRPEAYQPRVVPYQVFGDPAARVVLITYGRLFSYAAEAMTQLAARQQAVRVIKLNRILPLPAGLRDEVAGADGVFFYEEGVRIGGIGMQLGAMLAETNFRGDFILKAIPNTFVPHATMRRTLEKLELTEADMVREIQKYLMEKRGDIGEKKAGYPAG